MLTNHVVKFHVVYSYINVVQGYVRFTGCPIWLRWSRDGILAWNRIVSIPSSRWIRSPTSCEHGRMQ